jgi:hypothetical protein
VVRIWHAMHDEVEAVIGQRRRQRVGNSLPNRRLNSTNLP